MLTVFQSQLVYFLMQGRLWLTIATLAELALVFVASSMASKNSPSGSSRGILLYSVLNWLLPSVLWWKAFYTQGTVLSAFVSKRPSLLCYGGSRYVHQEDLSGLGRAMMAALIGLLIAMVVNIFLGKRFL